MIRLATLVASLLFSLVAVAHCSAQWRPYVFQPVRSVDRWLGIGYGNGYHWRVPGSDVSYYDVHSGVGLSASANTDRADAAPWAWPTSTPSAGRPVVRTSQLQTNFSANLTRPVSHQEQLGQELPSVLLAPVSEFQPMPKAPAEKTRYRSPFSR